MDSNGEKPARLNSRTITVWLPQADIDYADEIAAETGVPRNRAIRNILDDHRKLRIERVARRK